MTTPQYGLQRNSAGDWVAWVADRETLAVGAFEVVTAAIADHEQGPPTQASDLNDTVAALGFVRTSGHRVQCLHCKQHFTAAGDVMRSHRRNCTVKSWDPKTPGVCNA